MKDRSMKPYTVIFPTGMAGSFFIYFIACHKEFLGPGLLELDSQHPYYKNIKHINLHTDLTLEPNNWITDEGFRNRLNHYKNEYPKKKLVCKIRPHYYDISEFLQNLALLNVIVLYTSKVFELYNA